VYSIL